MNFLLLSNKTKFLGGGGRLPPGRGPLSLPIPLGGGGPLSLPMPLGGGGGRPEKPPSSGGGGKLSANESVDRGRGLLDAWEISEVHLHHLID